MSDRIPRYDETWTPEIERFLQSQNILSGVSDRTRKKYLGDLSKYLSKEESEHSRRAIVCVSYLQNEMERCANAKSHLAVGIICMALIEDLLVVHFLDRKVEVTIAPAFQKARASLIKSNVKKKTRPSFLKVVSSMRLEDLHRLAIQISLFDMKQLADSNDCLIVVKRAGYPGDLAGLLRYLQDSRNAVHLNRLARNLPSIVPGHIIDPRDMLREYHHDFAFVAIRVRGLLINLPRRNKLIIRPF